MDQVGVKAPGRPTIITFFFANLSPTLIISGGNPKCRSILDGMASPTDTASVAVAAMPASNARDRRMRILLFEE